MKCCICGAETKVGNNPSPVAYKGRCCDKCNADIVIPQRLKKLQTDYLK